MEGPRFASLGAVLEACRDTALREWRKEYAPATRVSDLFANDLRGVRMLTDELPGGVLLITITIRPRLRWQQETYFTKANLFAGEYYLS